MTATLSTARDQLETRLQDTTNLIWSTDTLDEALRAALGELSKAYGTPVTLKDLDSALLTNYDDLDHHVLLEGAVAYALRFRLINKFDQGYPAKEDPEDIARAAAERMDHFQGLLTQVRLRKYAESTDAPYSPWAWDEGRDFS